MRGYVLGLQQRRDALAQAPMPLRVAVTQHTTAQAAPYAAYGRGDHTLIEPFRRQQPGITGKPLGPIATKHAAQQEARIKRSIWFNAQPRCATCERKSRRGRNVESRAFAGLDQALGDQFVV